MDLVTDSVGNPTVLLIERVFWLGLGVFLGLAIITSSFRGLKERKKNTRPVSPDQLKILAKRAIKKNSTND
tara:strand:+ start:232 stop:444 length:213 start_codon:yes stop_codon:yes gene_type:complete